MTATPLSDAYRYVGDLKVSLLAPPEIKALVATRYFLQEVILDALIRPNTLIYGRVCGWLQRAKLAGLDDSLDSASLEEGLYFKDFLRDTLEDFRDWAKFLDGVSQEESCNEPLEAYCEFHGDTCEVTTEAIFAAKLKECLGFLRCIVEQTPTPIFEVEGEEEGVASYMEMMDEERKWRQVIKREKPEAKRG